MTVLHSEDADWCVSMTTTEKRGKGRRGGRLGWAERREEVERGRKWHQSTQHALTIMIRTYNQSPPLYCKLKKQKINIMLFKYKSVRVYSKQSGVTDMSNRAVPKVNLNWVHCHFGSYVHVCVHHCVWLCMYSWACIHLYTYIYVYILCVRACLHACLHASVYVCVHVRTWPVIYCMYSPIQHSPLHTLTGDTAIS